jgi:hypothetical protein
MLYLPGTPVYYVNQLCTIIENDGVHLLLKDADGYIIGCKVDSPHLCNLTEEEFDKINNKKGKK